ncbi:MULTISPECIES: metal-dependent phosphohydrolase [unclassified Burkholderia]|uniref:metal-dependent phosphohydrolase n=1 Tax=unclassified Burkholderia TaxID=2613784 RepID=UPI002AB132E8|nr:MULTISPECIES: metal-dependent phosphohydrolase [unclassified Burkholderia]
MFTTGLEPLFRRLLAAGWRSHSTLPTDILTVNGRYFNFLAPEDSVFGIEDIAHGLSNICRFTGQTCTFYSVAQHAELVSRVVPPQFALAGLLHDGAEAFLGDITSPLKRMLPQYRKIEKRVEREIFRRFGLPYPMPREVKWADQVVLVTEQRDLMTLHPDEEPRPKSHAPLAGKIVPVSPTAARALFLARFRELTAASQSVTPAVPALAN